MSQIAEFHAAILQNLPELGSEEMQKWIGPNRSLLKMVLAQALAGMLSASHRHIVIDYGQALEQMITAGRYDWTNSDITAEHFPIKGNGTITLETRLFHFNRRVSSEEAVRLIVSADPTNPWQAARIEHELAYGATYPEEQRQFPIVALGSSCQILGDRYVSYLGRYGAERDLGLSCWGDDWSAHYRFLAVRPISVRQPAD